MSKTLPIQNRNLQLSVDFILGFAIVCYTNKTLHSPWLSRLIKTFSLTGICYYCDKSPIKAFVRPHACYVICFTSIYLLYFGSNSVIPI